jgi:hypothetical protein
MNEAGKIKNILKGKNRDILNNLDTLEKIYKEKTGKDLNRGCSACINEMVLTLKHLYNMSEFQFTKPKVQYKNKKGDTTTISNATMTDEKAVAFLKTDPKRIKLFKKYPSNWQDLIAGKVETEAEKEKRLAIEAELKAAEDAKKAESEKDPVKDTVKDPVNKPSREELEKMGMSALRQAYPEIKANSIEAFIEKVLS